MPITPDYRSQIERKILETLARALEEKLLNEQDSADVARFILDHLDSVQDHSQLIEFLDVLSRRWPVFSQLGNVEMAKVIEEKKTTVTTKIEQQMHQGNIQGALETAQILKAQAQ